MADHPHIIHKSPRTAMRYVNPGPAAVAEVTELLNPPNGPTDGWTQDLTGAASSTAAIRVAWFLE
ncbi:MAG: hypothetical protein ACRD2W_06335 [Acidimicrobiales bacterium]